MGDKNLTFGNILGEDEIDTLFSDPGETSKEEDETQQEEETSEKEDKAEKKSNNNNTTEAVNPNELFDEEDSKEEQHPEGVGSGEKEETKGEDKEDATTDKDSGTSPNQNFYSSIANALAVDGIFPNLDEDTVKKANDAEGFSDLIEAEVNARLTEKQQRVAKALANGAEPNQIKRFENTLDYINSLTETQISAETEEGEKLRGNLIYQDFINKGYTPEKAQKYTKRTIDAGTDIEDAKDALQSNKQYFQSAYNRLQQEAAEAAQEEKEERQKEANKLKDSILKDKQLLGDMSIDNNTRKRALDNITRPVYKDPETGEYYTALQKYEMENRGDFIKKVGLIFTVTDGFKDFDSFFKGKVKKGVRKGLKELEEKLNNTSRDSDGNLRMVTSAKEDPESYMGGWQLDI